MNKKLSFYIPEYLDRTKRYIKWKFTGDSRESVYFYTFHKCASSLFSGYVLGRVEGLRQVDYAYRIYVGKMSGNPVFNERGYIYGPLRLSLRPTSPEYTRLVKDVTDAEFIKNRIAVFLIRDPRDILVSAYYSFGYTHGLSPVKEIQAMQLEIREQIQNTTIDQYCLQSAPRINSAFETLNGLSQACNRSIVLKYEDMINDWDTFSAGLTRYLDIREDVLARIYEQSRPMKKTDTTSHRRDGKPGGFRDQLQKETIDSLNDTFRNVLETRQYTI